MDNWNWIEVEQFAKTMPVGGMVHGRFSDGGVWRTGLFIQADRGWLERLSRNPHVEMRFGLFNEARAAPVFWMARISGELFESWINWAVRGGREAIEDLAGQAEIVIHLYNRRSRVRSISVSNQIARTAASILEQLEGRVWSDEDFEAARNAIYDRYPTPAYLWTGVATRGVR